MFITSTGLFNLFALLITYFDPVLFLCFVLAVYYGNLAFIIDKELYK